MLSRGCARSTRRWRWAAGLGEDLNRHARQLVTAAAESSAPTSTSSPATGSRITRASPNNGERDTSTASCLAILAPGRPPSASPTRVSKLAANGLRR